MTRSRSKKTLVVFDIGNVLLNFSVGRARDNFERAVPGSGDVLCRAMWESSLGEDLESGRITGRGFFDRALRGSRLALGYGEFKRAFRDIFTPIKENLGLLNRLSRRHPTALLSNVSALHWSYLLASYPLLKSARWRFASYRLKCLKPDPAIYHHVARRTRYDFRDMVYVDDRSDFILSAKKLGIRAHRYDGSAPLKKILAREGIR